jgi:hypothetical protein
VLCTRDIYFFLERLQEQGCFVLKRYYKQRFGFFRNYKIKDGRKLISQYILEYIMPALTLQAVEFTTSGTWVVPDGVTKIIVFAIAGGGGGGGSCTLTGGNGNTGGNGGSTVVSGSDSGTLFSLTGGDGGKGGRIDSSGNKYNGSAGARWLNIPAVLTNGRSSVFGLGGISSDNARGADASGYGAGGGGSMKSAYASGGGGGDGQPLIGGVFSVVSGETLSITIGAGGSGGGGAGSSSYSGGNGSPGFVKIFYLG